MKALSYCLLLVVCSSCLSLEAVQQYAAASTEATDTFSGIQLTFQDLCQRKRQLRDLRQSRVLRTYQDSCAMHQQADSTVIKIQGAIQDYLTALHTISSGERVRYSLAPLQEALTGSGLVSLQAPSADAYRNLLELVTTASTEAYRRRQVERLVTQAHPPLTALLDQLTKVLDESWREAIRQQKAMMYLHTRELADSAQTFMERQEVLRRYIDEARYYEQQEQLLDTHVAVLQVIQEGHQQLYERRDQLHRRETVAGLAFYVGELRSLQRTLDQKSTE